MPQDVNQGDFRVSRCLGFVFFVIKRVWQVWSYSKSWCIPNYQLTVSFKNSSFFFCLIFKEFEKKFLNQEFYGQLPEQAWSTCSFDFSKIMPLGAPKSLVQMVLKWKGSVYRDGFITNSNHQFFPDPKSNIWTIFSFSFFFNDFMIMKFIPF